MDRVRSFAVLASAACFASERFLPAVALHGAEEGTRASLVRRETSTGAGPSPQQTAGIHAKENSSSVVARKRLAVKADEFAALVEGPAFVSQPVQLSALRLRHQAQTDSEDEAGFEAIGASEWMTVSSDNATLFVEPKRIRLFCFAWTARRSMEEDVLPEIKRQFEMCDGHAIFTDADAQGPEAELVRVSVPTQDQSRGSATWLYHRNMAGIMPAWTYLFKNDLLANYDWVLNTEFDHFTRPTQVRQAIGDYVKNLWAGTGDERLHVGKAMMLMWGNAYVFNAAMVRDMKKQWPALGKTMPAGTKGTGCPDWMEGHSFWPAECAQDIVYPILAMVMNPPVPAYGAAGCGQRPLNGLGHPYPLACYQMSQNPLGGASSANAEIAIVKAIASANTGSDDTTQLLFDQGELEAGPMLLTRSYEGTETDLEKYASKVESLMANLGELAQGGEGVSSLVAKRAAQVVGQLEHFQQELLKQDVTAEWDLFVPNFTVPIMHEVRWSSVHALARRLLKL